MSKQYKLLMVLLLPNSPCYQSQISIAESENIIPLNRSSCKNKKEQSRQTQTNIQKKAAILSFQTDIIYTMGSTERYWQNNQCLESSSSQNLEYCSESINLLSSLLSLSSTLIIHPFS
jgi:hypothetical protein